VSAAARGVADPLPTAAGAPALADRADLAAWLIDLLAPLSGRWTAGGAGLDLGAAGASYSARVVRLEGWSRVLWGTAPLLAGGGDWAERPRQLEGLRSGPDPLHSAYWGEPGDSDQRLVEMAAIALALLIAPQAYWEPLAPAERDKLYAWLAAIEKRSLPANNWHFFRVLVGAAFRTLGLPVDEAAQTESFDLIESLYRGDGWYRDAADGNFDSYNPFGFHFYGLVYAKLMGGRDPERAQRYVDRARAYAPQFLAYFRADGSAVPYGRSLCYRFALISFCSACAFAGVEALPWGVMKGLLLRNLRWWANRPIRDAAGLLTVGYAYPNLVMAEQYNSPGSPYWAAKAFLVLALGDDHPFWRAAEAPLPDLPAVARLAVPAYLIQRSAADVQLLNPGRYPSWQPVQAAAKYAKFAYSARFGFCVSHGGYGLEMAGGDSSLLLSEGDGYWRERRQAEDLRAGPDWARGRWRPWPDVEVETTLIALGDWHLRVHRIASARRLEAVEGGFALPRYAGGEAAPAPEIRLGAEAALAYPWAGSRIVDLSASAAAAPGGAAAVRTGRIVYPEPNLNILHPLVAYPALAGSVGPGVAWLASAVRAGERAAAEPDQAPELNVDADGALRYRRADGGPGRIGADE
jgi:hypothetical protein